MGKTVHRGKSKRIKVRDPNFAPMLKRKSGPHKDRRRAIQEELDKLEQDRAVEQVLWAEEEAMGHKFFPLDDDEDDWYPEVSEREMDYDSEPGLSYEDDYWWDE